MDLGSDEEIDYDKINKLASMDDLDEVDLEVCPRIHWKEIHKCAACKTHTHTYTQTHTHTHTHTMERMSQVIALASNWVYIYNICIYI
jgi:hypothetical protein